MKDWNLDENSLSKLQQLQHCKFVMPICFYKEQQINFWFKFSVGDTTRAVYN